MAKRVADKYITDQNWDEEDQHDDDAGPGVFKRADQEVLKSRVIRKAKRRATPGQSTATSAFTGFSGFKVPADGNSGGSLGGFRLPPKNGTSFGAPQSQGFTLFQASPSTAPQANTGSEPVPSFPTMQSETSVTAQVVSKSSDEEESSQTSKEYNRHLSALNKSVSEWIKNHVEKNPLCDLTPIFLDYKKYLSEIDEKYGHSDSEAPKSPTQNQDTQESISSKSTHSSTSSSQDSVKSDKTEFKLTGFSPTSDMTSKTDSKPAEAPASKPFMGFQVPVSAPSTSPFKGFNTGGSKVSAFTGFSFSSKMVGAGSSEAPTQEGSKSSAEDDEYVPPKPESNVVVEEDAFFTIRCKLYYKKDDSYTDRGVGQLYLKPAAGKTQLLIRADTAISQILLNILLSPSIPMKRQGKNNILIMCIPNPPINEKEKDQVMTLLVRVKTSDDADNLLEIMEKKKKEAEEIEQDQGGGES